MKTAILKTLIWCGILTAIVACKGNMPQDTVFCDYVQKSDFQKVADITDNFLATVDNSLNDSAKIETLKNWLLKQSCVENVEIMCVSCIYTLPPQSELSITFSVNNTSVTKIMDIGMGEPLRCGFHTDYSEGNVLMLKVDYLTQTFEGGYEFSFQNLPENFNLRQEYRAPGDFGYVKYYYDETGEMLFYGTIIWMGCGQIYYPENLLPASAFDVVPEKNYVFPANGFENISAGWQPENENYESVWANVQDLRKVRNYLSENAGQKVKIFLYTPSVGVGDPADWDWILFLKK